VEGEAAEPGAEGRRGDDVDAVDEDRGDDAER